MIWKLVSEVMFSQEQADVSVFQNESESFRWVLRVKRQISAAGFENTQDADEHFHGRRHQHGDRHIGSDTSCLQVVGQLVSPPVQFSIAHLLLSQYQGDSLRRALC